jgi:hypothetical protein
MKAAIRPVGDAHSQPFCGVSIAPTGAARKNAGFSAASPASPGNCVLGRRSGSGDAPEKRAEESGEDAAVMDSRFQIALPPAGGLCSENHFQEPL